MAVEAHHLRRLFSPEVVMDREPIKVAENQPMVNFGNMETGVAMPLAMSGLSSFPFYSPGTTPSESGLTVSGRTGRKRERETLSFLDEEISAHFQQQMLDLDLLLSRHREALRAELAERRHRFSRQLAAAIEDGVRKRLKAKEDEMERLRKLNWALEERIRTLCVENQIWRELAQTNEATANLLRSNLEQLLAAQIRIKEEHQQIMGDEAAAATADDAESCCCGGNDDRESVKLPARACRSCGAREPTVFLLPCRHLCFCADCDPKSSRCPICNSCKSGSVHVNLS
ncbi:hypothetical protein KSP39_PZI002949 [Platanthera zijinensis]|uniref:RING-type domain-containing protein n=1 Tax=Platanthera zijinensis TaxID=2320716 RepID=A0AAP0C147_9ASPA